MYMRVGIKFIETKLNEVERLFDGEQLSTSLHPSVYGELQGSHPTVKNRRLVEIYSFPPKKKHFIEIAHRRYLLLKFIVLLPRILSSQVYQVLLKHLL